MDSAINLQQGGMMMHQPHKCGAPAQVTRQAPGALRHHVKTPSQESF